MDDLRALLHQAVPDAPELDLTGVARRSHVLRRRRRTVVTALSVVVVVGAAGAAASLTGAAGGTDAVLTPYGGPAPAASAGSATATPTGVPAPVAAGIVAPPPQRLAETDDFGRISDIAQDGSWLRVERYDMLTGEEAERAAAAEGRTPDAGYYLRFRPESWTRYDVSSDAAVWGSILLSGTVEHTRENLPRLVKFVDDAPGSQQALFHLDVQDGVIVGIEEQYRP
jgi:hypothetical protein